MKDTQQSPEDPLDHEKFFRFNIMILRMIGLFPPNDMKPLTKFLYNVCSAFVVILLASCLISQTVAMFYIWGTFVMVSNTLCVMFGMIVGLADCFFFVSKREQVVELMKIIRSDFICKMKPKYSYIPVKAQKSLVVSGTIKSIFSFLLGSSAFTTALFHITDLDIETEEAWKNMPFVVLSPFDVNEISGRFYILCYEVFVSGAVLVSTLAVDLAILALINQVTGQYQYLIALLDNIDEEFKEAKMKRYSLAQETGNCISQENLEGEAEEEWYKNYLKECIRLHQSIIQYTDDLKSLVSLPIFIQIGNVPIMVCLTGFNMTVGDNTPDQSLKFVVFFLASIYKLFLYCWFGQDLINVSENLQHAVYGCRWYLRKQGFKGLLPMMIMRSSRITSMSASVFFDLSFNTFSSFMNSSYTYFTLMNQMNESE